MIVAQEIERKFLLKSEAWRDEVSAQDHYRQGYLANTDRCSVRVRVTGTCAYLNIKSATLDIGRTEHEYEIPKADGEQMLADFCIGGRIEKTRYFVERDGHTWEIDVFERENHGLILAEIELEHRDEAYTRPEWLGEEVSQDPRYYNVYLARHPYSEW